MYRGDDFVSNLHKRYRADDMVSDCDPLKTYKHAVKARPPISTDASRYRVTNPGFATTPDKPKHRKKLNSATTPDKPKHHHKHHSATYALGDVNMSDSASEDDESEFRMSECDVLLEDLASNPKRSPSLDRCFQRARKQLKVLDKLEFLEKAQMSEHEKMLKDIHESASKCTKTKRIAFQLPWCKTFMFVLAMLVLCLVTTLMIKKMKSPAMVLRVGNLEERMNEKLNQLQLDFPNQKSKFKLLRVAVKAIVLGEPKQPAIVTLLASSGAETTTSCFARSLAGTIESIFEENKEFIHKSGHELRKKLLEPGLIKKDLDDAATGGFNNGSRVFLLENFNVIPIDSAMIFHGLCDDNFAPFKKVLYLFTVNLLDLGISSFAKDYELKTFEVTRGWSNDLDEDQLASLESRIGTYKLVIEPEPDENKSLLKKKWNC